MAEPLRRLGKYEIIGEVGKGGFATVYRARDLELERDVALKILDPLLTRDPVWVARFRREARAVAGLEHPRIVTVYEIGQSEGLLFIAMKLVDGGSLAQRLAQSGRLAWLEVVRLAGEIGQALDFAHGKGVLHRDLKPANVLLDSQTGSVLTDFGFARLVADNSMSISMSGGVVGTPAYIAPEVWEGAEPTPQADIYALGCIVYEMIVGRALFTGATPPAVMLAHFKPPALPEVWPEQAPAGVRELLATALEKDPAARYARAGDFAAALASLAEDTLAKPYAALQAAVAAQTWPEAMALAGEIRARQADYRDVAALERQAAAGLERAARVQSAAQWRATAEEALAAGDLAGAQVAVRQWQQVMPDDPKLAAFKSQLAATDQGVKSRAEPAALSKETVVVAAHEVARSSPDAQPQALPALARAPSPTAPNPSPPFVQGAKPSGKSGAPLGVILLGVAMLAVVAIGVFAVSALRGYRNPTVPASSGVITVEVTATPERVQATVPTTEAPPQGVAPAEPTQVAEPAPIAAPTIVPLPKVLRINLGSYPNTIDPQKSGFTNEIAHLQLIYEGLTRIDTNLQTVPGAAEAWRYNADATKLEFKLRSGLKYNDGSPLNAERFAYAIKRNINPETAGEYAAITDEIAGAPEWRGCDLQNDRAGCDRAAEKVTQNVKASHRDGRACEGYEDAACNTLTLVFSKPAPYFHTIMSIWVIFPAKEELINEGRGNWWNSSRFQIGNGPYILDKLEPAVKAVFVPNPNYWRGTATVDIQYSYVEDSAAALAAYKNGEFDIVYPSVYDLDAVQADAQLSKEVMAVSGSCTFAVMFHQLKEPFTDQKVREAFAMALDRSALVREVPQSVGNSGTPTLTWIPPGYPGYDAEENRWGFDPEAAKAALAASSYRGVRGLPPITATFSDTPRNRARWEWLTAQWKSILGVDIKLNPVESTAYAALTRDIKTAPQMFILGWCADYPDPQNWLTVYWKTGGFGERIGYSNPDFDALVDEADEELDPAARMELYAQAQKLLTDGAPVAFAWNNVYNYLVKPWVKGITPTPQDSVWPGSQDALTIDIDTSMIPR